MHGEAHFLLPVLGLMQSLQIVGALVIGCACQRPAGPKSSPTPHSGRLRRAAEETRLNRKRLRHASLHALAVSWAPRSAWRPGRAGAHHQAALGLQDVGMSLTTRSMSTARSWRSSRQARAKSSQERPGVQTLLSGPAMCPGHPRGCGPSPSAFSSALTRIHARPPALLRCPDRATDPA